MSSVQPPTLKENTPTREHDSRRLPQIQEQSLRQGVSISKAKTPSRQSLGPNFSFTQNQQPVNTTSMATTKRLSTTPLTKSSLTAKRAQPIESTIVQPTSINRNSNSETIIQPRLMGPVNPPTLVPASIKHNPTKLVLPRTNTGKDLRVQTFQSPGGQSGNVILFRSMAGTGNEVRLPRPSTFHNLPRGGETPPPVPPIPEEYRSPLCLSSRHSVDSGLEPKACHPLAVPEIQVEPTMPSPKNDEQKAAIGGGMSTPPMELSSHESSDSDESLSLVRAWPIVSSKASAFLGLPRPMRPWSILEQCDADANTKVAVQVKHYMSPVWWAGRFQSRLDQWRTEAMRAELDPGYKPEGTLSQCRLNQDKVAGCFIFLQLRNLCANHEAADSLWVILISKHACGHT